MRRPPAILLIAAILAVLTGCQTAPAGMESAPSASATAACPMQLDVPSPTDCAVYDPDAAMAQNDLYRQRIELDADTQASAEAHVADARAVLEALRSDGTITADAVRAALEDVGLRDVQIRTGAGDVLFGAVPPDGGCVYGALEAERVTVDAGGYIMDGGCLPAQ